MRNMTMPARAAALTLSALALAMTTISAASSANAATGEPDVGMPTEMRVALQRDMGLTPAQIPRYATAEKRVREAGRKARDTLGTRYAGSWLERDRSGEYQAVVAVVGASEAGKIGAPGVQVRVVAHSLAQLHDTQARLDTMAGTFRTSGKRRTLHPSIQSWHVDPMSNRVVVAIDRGAKGAALDFVAASGADAGTVRFVESDSRPRLAQQAIFNVRGGDRYFVPNGGSCSIGFAVTFGAANGFITAGHCGTANTPLTHDNGQSLGYIIDSVFPGSDYAIAHNTNPQGIPRPWVNSYAGGHLEVRGATPTVVGAPVCRSGARTGLKCGTLLAVGVTVPYAGNTIGNLSSTTACVGAGDSGGAFLTPEGQAQGVTSGGNYNVGDFDYNNCADSVPGGTAASYFQPLQPILAQFPGLTLMTAP